MSPFRSPVTSVLWNCTQTAEWAEAVGGRVSFTLHSCVHWEPSWAPFQDHLFLPDQGLPYCSDRSTTLQRNNFSDKLLISTDNSGKKMKQEMAMNTSLPYINTRCSESCSLDWFLSLSFFSDQKVIWDIFVDYKSLADFLWQFFQHNQNGENDKI